MKTPKHSRRGGRRSNKTDIELLRLIERHLMSPQSGAHAEFTRVKLEGSNVGSTMMIRRAGEEESSDRINVYVSNNVQGVNNSILVGSTVQLGDPGVRFSVCDEHLHRDKRANGNSIFFGVLICFVIAILFFFVTGNNTS